MARKILDGPLTPSEREGYEQLAFDTLQNLKMAEDELQIVNEQIALNQQLELQLVVNDAQVSDAAKVGLWVFLLVLLLILIAGLRL